MTTKKCTKKRNAPAQLLFCQSKPIAFWPLSLPSSLVKLPEEASEAAEIETVVAVIIVFCILHSYYMQLKHIVISDWGRNAKLGVYLPKSGDYGNWVWAILWREDDSRNKGILWRSCKFYRELKKRGIKKLSKQHLTREFWLTKWIRRIASSFSLSKRGRKVQNLPCENDFYLHKNVKSFSISIASHLASLRVRLETIRNGSFC